MPPALDVITERFELPLILAATGAGAPSLPTEFRIFPFGKISTTKGEFEFNQDSAKSVMDRAAKWNNSFSMDYEHSGLERKGPDPAAPAAAWYKLEIRSDGLWATAVEWTKRAAEYLANREYRYFSPAFTQVKNVIRELINIGLTNLPATKGMQPLVASQTAGETGEARMSMPRVLLQLGLAADASEDSAFELVKKLTVCRRVLLEMTGADDDVAAFAILEKAMKRSKKFKKLKAKLEEAEKAKVQAEAGDFIGKSIKEGRLAPSQKEWALDLAGKDYAALKDFIKRQPVVPLKYREATEEPPNSVVDAEKLSKKAKRISSMLGVTAEQFAESMKRHQARQAIEDDDDADEEAELAKAIPTMTKDDPKSFIETGKVART